MSSSRSESPSRFGLTRPVWLLGWVSFFTDMASEMVYPLLPLFLTQVLGAGAMSLGVIEGAAEAANSALEDLVRMAGGSLAFAEEARPSSGTASRQRVRPLIGFATAWPQVLAIRFSDRLGKGIRGAPRDAMLADFAPASTRGRVFGFHRAMDHAGAVTGPLLATAFLYFYPGNYRTLFFLTVIPGIIVILFVLRIPESVRTQQNPKERTRENPAEPGRPLWNLGNRFYRAMAVILLFSLGNASDAFLLLRLSDLGVPSVWIPLLWSALHVVKVVSSLVGGAMSDKFGRRGLIALGWLWYALVYAGFGYFDTKPTVIAIFLAYGLYFGLTEGNEKAWVADMAPAARARYRVWHLQRGAGGRHACGKPASSEPSGRACPHTRRF